MAAKNFDLVMSQVLGIEGGVSDRPLKDDPGGLTNLGITQATYNDWRKLKGLAPKSVKEITRREAVAIGRNNYWKPTDCDVLPSGLDLAVFDFAFNSGPHQAVLELQRTIGVNADGQVGVQTRAALVGKDIAKIIRAYCDRRWVFMQGLDNFKANKNGWRSRVDHVKAQGVAMAIGEEVAEPHAELTSAPLAKAPPPPPPEVKKSLSIWGAIAAFFAMIYQWFENLLLAAPDFAKQVLGNMGVFMDKSPIAATIGQVIAAAGAAGVAYAGLKLYQQKRAAQADKPI